MLKFGIKVMVRPSSVPRDLWNWHLVRYKSDYHYYY